MADVDPELVEAVETFILQRGGVTFVEIADFLQACGVETKGDRALCLPPPNDNIILWVNMSDVFVQVTHALRRRNRVEPYPTVFLTYLADGSMPTLPLATKVRAYTTPHWLPVAFDRKGRNPKPTGRGRPKSGT